MKNKIKRFLIFFSPLKVRKLISIILAKQKWLNNETRNWWAEELIRDLEDFDLNKFHQFLWENHIGYAQTYNIDRRFELKNMEESRKLFFLELEMHLKSLGIDPHKNIESVFELGCSLGYQLNYLEQNVFTNANTFYGIDLDKYAICCGKQYLKTIGSSVKIDYGNMVDLEFILNRKKYDIILANGVLLYVCQDIANTIVKTMLKHTNIMLCISGLAHPDVDNRFLKESTLRESDKTFIHNIDEMILNARGKILARRWDGPKLVKGHSIYFIFAVNN